MKYFSNLQRYDEKGRRVAIYGRQLEENTSKMEIFILTCSKKDNFNKRLSREVYDIYVTRGDKKIVDMHSNVYTPTILSIDIANVTTPKKCFLDWCKANFYFILKREIPITGKVRSLKFSSKTKTKTYDLLSINALYK